MIISRADDCRLTIRVRRSSQFWYNENLEIVEREVEGRIAFGLGTPAYLAGPTPTY
jgi:hypothetical protein